MIKNFLKAFLNIFLLSCLMVSGDVGAGDKPSGTTAVAVFAGGCFWCMEHPFDALPSVISTISGYMGGHIENPTYKEVSNGKTGHSEALQVTYDPAKVSYEKLLEVFWRNIDPFDDDGQFCDKGDQYRAAIFYQDDTQKQLAEASKTEIAKKFPNRHVATTIKAARKFFPAEDYHQGYYLSNPAAYEFYRFTCGRDHRLSQIWDE